jgi:hypothetical protein
MGECNPQFLVFLSTVKAFQIRPLVRFGINQLRRGLGFQLFDASG